MATSKSNFQQLGEIVQTFLQNPTSNDLLPNVQKNQSLEQKPSVVNQVPLTPVQKSTRQGFQGIILDQGAGNE